MPYTNNCGIRIYYEVEGQGPPILFMHGTTRTHMMWRLGGYVKALNESYRLILQDARGCGKSDKPYDINAYTPELMTGDSVALLDTIGIEKTNFWGYSMGGRIGFQLIKHHPPRFRSFVLCGMSPFPLRSAAEKLDSDNTIARIRLGAEQGPDAVIAFREKTLGRVESEAGKQRIRGNDYNALLRSYTKPISMAIN